MNTQLQKLFVQYNLSEKDRYEINQIYTLLPSGKQKNLLNNFPILAQRLKQIEEEINEEREILVGNSIEVIKNKILKNRINSQIQDLKSEL